jgi:hypothetical protein
MSCQDGVYQWTTTVRQQLPQLSKPQATVLALWSLGMVLARSCALSAVSLLLAGGLDRKPNTVRQQLREWCYAAEAKRGERRQELDVTRCFAPLLGWVLGWWQGTQVALALDATSLGDRFVVLALSVAYRGCAIPVAWTILPANQKHAWRGEWLRLLRRVWRVIPGGYTVIVLADRGLYAPWLYRRIVRLGWHPFLRINLGGTFRPACSHDFRPLRSFVPTPGGRWQGTGVAFKTNDAQLPCTLLACWEVGYTDPWLILTDLPPDTADAAWYGLRAWIEQGFKITKRGGWQWQRTRMTDPQRAARLWLAVAVATLWLLSVGGAAEPTIPASTLPDVSAALGQQRRRRAATRLRLVSSFRRGWTCVLAALFNHQPLPLGRFIPEPWPAAPTTASPNPPMPKVQQYAQV